MVQALRLSGITHACLGNHEADLIMPTLEERIREISQSVKIINTNLRPAELSPDHWLLSLCNPHEIITTPCGRVNVGLLGLLSDEPPLYVGGTFHHLPLGDVLESYSRSFQKLVPGRADYVVSLTHQTIDRDRDLARHILRRHSECGHQLLIGGHEHDPHEEDIVEGDSFVRICKSGQDAEHASIIDISFDLSTERPRAVDVSTELVDLQNMSDAIVVKSVVDVKMKGLEKMGNEIIVDDSLVPSSVKLCSTGSGQSTTTFGSFACDAIKHEMQVDAAILPGNLIQGESTYPCNHMTYKQIKKEFPSKIKMVCVPMSRNDLEEVIDFSRQNNNEAFLHVDTAFGASEADGDEQLAVAVHMPLLRDNQIPALTDLGQKLKIQGLFPGSEDWIPGLYLVVRFCCHARWSQIMRNFDFNELDLNSDGVLDRDEIKSLMTKVLGHEPEDYNVDDMIRAIDEDDNGVIDRSEFDRLLNETQKRFS
mmetsp:Transcript_48791/g.147011  ORF Transcript_48791/g.147011 Transcript_48791/m.147011 type:complete len:480 (-) Transcript_48791:298-1737(-)